MPFSIGFLEIGRGKGEAGEAGSGEGAVQVGLVAWADRADMSLGRASLHSSPNAILAVHKHLFPP